MTHFLMSVLGHPFVKTALALIEDAALVIIAVLCVKAVGMVVHWVFPSGWVHDSFDVLKGFGVLILYVYFFVQLILKLYNASKEQSHGAHSVLAV